MRARPIRFRFIILKINLLNIGTARQRGTSPRVGPMTTRAGDTTVRRMNGADEEERRS